MAGKEKFWTAGTLKSRGWTEQLISELLSPPRYRYFNGRRVRTWQKDEVVLAEQSDRFKTASEKLSASYQKRSWDSIDPAEAVYKLGEFFSELWEAYPSDNTAEYKLASLYHLALLNQIKSAQWTERVNSGQAMSYVRRFLSMSGIKTADELCGTLKFFIKASVWMGRSIGYPLMEDLKAQYCAVIRTTSKMAISIFSAAQPNANITKFLSMPHFPTDELISHPLGYIYSVSYVPQAIRTSLELLVELNPRDEYPEARAMNRHFVIHIGGTNTGKTYSGFQRLKEAPTGVYLAPLRLLALEAQEILLDAGIGCSLTTGEEEDRYDSDTHVAATAEKLDLKKHYDVAVIDECQMISDRERGYAWTRAILGVLAPEVHLCAAPQAKELLVRIIKSCGDSYEIVQHERKTPLICMNRVIDYRSIQPGDALITFSKVGVLSAAEDLRQSGKEPAIIYGALPYSTRRKQMEGFLSGNMKYVVATDAIGMGLNLPIRRVIFMETEKFDGVERRELKPEEIQQIAGRAGRYGMYNKGFVGATENLSLISSALQTVVPPLTYAVVGFSDLVLMVDFDLLEVLEVWNRMPTPDPYIKLDISRYITIISKMREKGFNLDKSLELRAANIPFDELEDDLMQLFYHFLRLYQAGEPLDQPSLPEKRGAYTLPELELYCRKLDLFFSFSKAFSCEIDTEELYLERERIADEINQILLHNLKNNIRFCARCGAALPLNHSGRLCAACYNRSINRRGNKIEYVKRHK